MSVTSIPLAVLRFQYRVARLPLQVAEDRFFARMDSDAPVRLRYERSLGLLDAAVGSVLRDKDLQRRGAALAERSDALSRATRLENAATRKRDHAEEELDATHDKVIGDIGQARESKERAVEDAKSAAAERKRTAEEDADKRAAEAKKRVDEDAARQTNTIESAKRAHQEEIRASEERSDAAAKAKLGDAEEKRRDAAAKRVQADRIEQLADIEKKKRRSERANNNA